MFVPLLRTISYPTATRPSVLGTVGIQEDADLGDRIEVDLLRHQPAVANFVADDPVDDDVAPVAARAATFGTEVPKLMPSESTVFS